MVDNQFKYAPIPDLKRDEVYISHVGDGEYKFNTFGGVYDDLMELLKAIAKKFKCLPTELYFVQYPRNKKNYFVYFFTEDKIIACITVEKLNPEEFEVGL